MAKQKQTLSGQLPVSSFTRLADLLSNQEGEVSVELSFGINERGVTFVHGDVATELQLQCQRCMDAVPFQVEQSFELTPVDATKVEADDFSGEYEPVVMDNAERVNVVNMIEDELLLSLPTIARHEEGQCRPQTDNV